MRKCEFGSSVLLALGMVGLLANMACSNDRRFLPKKGDPNELRYSVAFHITEEQWRDSQFCGRALPDLPEPPEQYRFDTDLIASKLASDEGMRAWLHGVVPAYKHYILTYRKELKDDRVSILDAEQFSLVPVSNEVKAQLDALHRHDEVRIKGKIRSGTGPFRHILVESVVVKKQYEHHTNNEYKFDFSKLSKTESNTVLAKVHAVVSEKEMGVGLVLEKDGAMIPIVADQSHAEFVKSLYRNDIVEANIRFVEYPGRPPHFVTDSSMDQAVRVVDYMANCHGKEVVLEGFLAKFHQSPAISTDVYALRLVDNNGIGRNFTFFPGVDPASEKFVDLFFAFKNQSEKVWNESDQSSIETVRNYWMNRTIKVRARGMMNVISTEQANPQIYLKDAKDLEFSVADE